MSVPIYPFNAPSVQQTIANISTSSQKATATLLGPQYALHDDDTFHSDSDSRSQLMVYAIVKFLAGSFASPMIVANTLQQVQYKPSDVFLEAINADSSHSFGSLNSEDEISEPDLNNYSSDDSDEPYSEFSDIHMSELDPTTLSKHTVFSPPIINAPTEASGYLARNSYDPKDPTRPPYQIDPLEGSSFGAIMKLYVHPDEGFKSLWKGNVTGWLYEMSFTLVQPTVEGMMNDILDLRGEAIPLVFLEDWELQLTTSVASHAITGFLLSPLELVRTRLIVQTSNTYHRKYRGTWHCLQTVLEEEGGFFNLYFGRHFTANVIYHTVAPFFKQATHFIIDRGLNISHSEAPILYGFCEFMFGALELMIIVPVDTVRRRLQCQVVKQKYGFTSRNDHFRPYETVVEQSSVPYGGMIDCMKRMIVEEGGRRGKGKGKKRKSGKMKSRDVGIGPLFKGLRMRLISLLILQVLRTFTDVEFE